MPKSQCTSSSPDDTQSILTFASPCALCGAPGDWLCDYRLGYRGVMREVCFIVGEKRPTKLERDFDSLEDFTCDAPMCDSHAFIVGTVFDFPEPGANHIDHCLIHRESMAWPEGGTEILTEEDAARLREDIWKRLSMVAVRKSEGRG